MPHVHRKTRDSARRQARARPGGEEAAADQGGEDEREERRRRRLEHGERTRGLGRGGSSLIGGGLDILADLGFYQLPRARRKGDADQQLHCCLNCWPHRHTGPTVIGLFREAAGEKRNDRIERLWSKAGKEIHCATPIERPRSISPSGHPQEPGSLAAIIGVIWITTYQKISCIFFKAKYSMV